MLQLQQKTQPIFVKVLLTTITLELHENEFLHAEYEAQSAISFGSCCLQAAIQSSNQHRYLFASLIKHCCPLAPHTASISILNTGRTLAALEAAGTWRLDAVKPEVSAQTAEWHFLYTRIIKNVLFFPKALWWRSYLLSPGPLRFLLTFTPSAVEWGVYCWQNCAEQKQVNRDEDGFRKCRIVSF